MGKVLAEGSRRTVALYALCFGVLVTILDGPIVVVSLPSIVTELGLPEGAVTWVVNAYELTFGGLLLLSGRLGDVYGRRGVFLSGVALFTGASAGCALASTPLTLLGFRALQGIGGACVAAVALPLINSLFATAGPRTQAIAVYGFVCAIGGGLGEVLGGTITSALSWRWIFVINLPVGVGVYAICATLLSENRPAKRPPPPDVAGAITITAALTLAIYALGATGEGHWRPIQTGCALGAAALFVVFLYVEAQARAPMVPPQLLQVRQFNVANSLGLLWSGAATAWFVMGPLYFRRVLGYDPLQVGLAFLPSDIVSGVFSVGLGAVVARLGTRGPLCLGLLICAAGLACFTRTPVASRFVGDILPGMLLVGLGHGMVLNLLLLAAVTHVDSGNSGLASGAINTTIIVGGALGLVVLASVARVRSEYLQHTGLNVIAAQNDGYHCAFLVGALTFASGAALGFWALPSRARALCS